MLKVLKNSLALPGLLWFSVRAIRKQKRYMAQNIVPTLKQSLVNSDGTIEPKNLKRITRYYGIAVPVISEIYKCMGNQKLSLKEREFLSYMGALTCLFDDYFDEKKPDYSHIKKMLNQPALQRAKNSHERLFLQFYLKTISIKDQNQYIANANQIYSIQFLSMEQRKQDLSHDRLRHITREKGGVSILFYRFALDGDISSLEKEFAYNVGFLGQLENDIFDIYEDFHNGIHTLANTSASIQDVKNEYLMQLRVVSDALMALDFPLKNKRRFMRFVNLIAARGVVALNQYLHLYDRLDFSPENHTREQLICDMAKPSNLFKWLKAYTSMSVK